MRSVFVGAALLAMMAASGVWAEPEIFWRETDTKRIKLKVNGEEILGRWEYPKKSQDAEDEDSSNGDESPTNGAAEASQPTEPRSGLWKIAIGVNPLNDSQSVVATLDATEGRNDLGQPYRLVVQRIDGILMAVLDWRSFLGMRPTNVALRIDSDPAHEDIWPVANGSTANVYPGDVTQLVKRIVRSKQIVAVCYPRGLKHKSARFQSPGLVAVLDELGRSGNWECGMTEMKRILSERRRRRPRR